MWRSCVITLIVMLCCSLDELPTSPRKAISAQPASPIQPTVPVGGIELPDEFSETVVATGITGATAMAVAPDGRIFVGEQTGALRVVKNDKLLAEPFLTVKVDSSWERGLIGVAVDPSFPRKPYVYVCYVAADPYPHHRISRFTANGDMAAANSELILFKGDDQRKIGGSVPNGHQGGAIHFGIDGKLYIGIGDQTAGLPAQNINALQGKLLRINPDGSIPDDNPFFKTARDKYRAVWAYGLRNPFAFAVQPGTGRILINDVGEASWEEIDEGVAGANYGWPHAEGPSADPRFKNPLYAYDHSQGRSITGGAFYNPATAQFPKSFVGKYFFADFMDNWIRVIDPNHPTDIQPFATGLAGPVDLQVGPDGSLYVLNRNAWVRDAKFKPYTGSLHRISFVDNSVIPVPRITAQPAEAIAGAGEPAAFRVEATGQPPLQFQWLRNGRPIAGADRPTLTFTAKRADDGAEFRCLVSNALGATKSHPATLWTTPLPKLLDTLRVGQNPRELPRLLSQTGIFQSVRDLAPAAGVVPYDVNSPLWSDGALKRRWLVLPKDTRIGFSEHGSWRFPAGTVFVKHFELAVGKGRPARRIETRLLVVDRRGSGYGVSYRWRADGSDAELLTEGLTEEIKLSDRQQAWSYPSRNDCRACHTAAAGFVLGVNTRQLNHPASDSTTGGAENLLAAWSRLGLFQTPIRNGSSRPDAIPRFDRLAAVSDSSATLQQRVRSYLDSNCAQCHRPGGTRAEFDARFETPLDRQRLVNGPVMSSNMGIGGAKLIVPGDPNRSMIYLRMNRRQDAFNMPPLATHLVDPTAVAVLAAWIQSLAAPVPKGAPKNNLGELNSSSLTRRVGMRTLTRSVSEDAGVQSRSCFSPAPKPNIQVSEVTLHGDMDCFKIETPSATYIYGKKGAGFASILDRDGRDWISYHPADKSKGEYHGLPKCGQPTKFFHCGYGYGMYKTADVFTSRVRARTADHVRIESATANGKSACAWDFFPDHATLTLTRIDLPTYWFLYEGTPGGKLHPKKDFVIRPDGTKTNLDQPWSQLVRWVCFATSESPIGLVLINHQEPEKGETDSYVAWPFKKEADGSFQDMTVFGFGRKGYKELIEHVPDLKRLPAKFSIAFVSKADHETAKTASEAILRLPND